MTQEEKARAYDEALDRAKDCLKDGTITSTAIDYIETIFHELKKSNDETIRKRLIDFFEDWHENRSHCWGIAVTDILTWLEKQGEQKPVDKVEPFDKYEGLTDFERTLADICIGWIGEELGWKQYIKDNADVLLKIAIKMFNSIQDAPFEKKSAWSDEDEENLQHCCMAISADGLHTYEDKQEMEAWLKSLKNRIGG